MSYKLSPVDCISHLSLSLWNTQSKKKGKRVGITHYVFSVTKSGVHWRAAGTVIASCRRGSLERKQAAWTWTWTAAQSGAKPAKEEGKGSGGVNLSAVSSWACTESLSLRQAGKLAGFAGLFVELGSQKSSSHLGLSLALVALINNSFVYIL